MKSKLIAIIYEGEKTEKQLVNNLNKCFFEDTELFLISFPAGQNIYMLWKQLKSVAINKLVDCVFHNRSISEIQKAKENLVSVRDRLSS